MYYRILGPTDIEQELNQIGEKNSKQIELEYFPMIPEEQMRYLFWQEINAENTTY